MDDNKSLSNHKFPAWTPLSTAFMQYGTSVTIDGKPHRYVGAYHSPPYSRAEFEPVAK